MIMTELFAFFLYIGKEGKGGKGWREGRERGMREREEKGVFSFLISFCWVNIFFFTHFFF